MTHPKKTTERPTALLRKAQVLDAAAECFRREGFHRSSMSQISGESGMSSGHIYHYFGSKEGIITAIVDRESRKLHQQIEDMHKASEDSDVVTAMVGEASKNMRLFVDSDHASLKMEILAEAARNPDIAKQIQKDDEEVRKGYYGLLGSDAPDIQSRCEILAALFEGLSVRALRNPDWENMLDENMLRRVIHHVLTS